MAWQGWLTVGVVLTILLTLTLTRVKADLVMLGALTILLTARVIRAEDALMGLANEGVVTIGVLFVVAAGLRETGAMALLSRRLLGRPRSVLPAQLRLMVPVAALSAFINKTPLVAVMLPVVADWTKQNRIAPSKLMLPLSYAAILGGLCTLIGTNTNLVLSGLAGQAGIPLHLFDPVWVGLPCAVVGIAYILVLSRWLLPDRGAALGVQDDPRQYTIEMLVTAGSPLAGQTIEEAGLRQLPGLFLVEIDRDRQILAAVAPSERLRSNDRLVFAGIIESVVYLQKIRGLVPATDQVFKLDSPRSHRCLIEAVVSDSCPLVGKTVRAGRFRTCYNAAIIALARNGERVGGKIGDMTLRAGDTLLLEAHPWFLEQQRNSRDFFLIGQVENSTPLRHEKAWVALAVMAGMVAVAGLGLLSMLNAALLAAGLMILTRCCSATEARRSVDWGVLVIVAASFGISRAMQVSGAAAAAAPVLLRLAGNHPWLALLLVYALTMLCTEVLSHAAAAVLVFPFALATAQTLQVNPLPFIFAMMMAASCGFATPISSPPNLMVYGPGGYRFSDYLRFGAPLNLILMAVTVVLAPLVWPF